MPYGATSNTPPSYLLEQHDVAALFILPEREGSQARHLSHIMAAEEMEEIKSLFLSIILRATWAQGHWGHSSGWHPVSSSSQGHMRLRISHSPTDLAGLFLNCGRKWWNYNIDYLQDTSLQFPHGVVFLLLLRAVLNKRWNLFLHLVKWKAKKEKRP